MSDAALPTVLVPDPGELGLVSDWPELRDRVLAAWGAFDTVLSAVDPAGPTRSRGRRARDLLVPLGAWPDARGIRQMLADARAGTADTEGDQAASDRLRAAHAGASDAEVIARVRRTAQHVADWVGSPDAAEEAAMVAPSPLGPVPVGTMIHAAAFRLAAVARDLRPAGAPDLPDLDALAVVSLVDSSGAVAARLDATASIAAVTPTVQAGTGTAPGAWRTVPAVADDAALGPAVVGPAGLLVDIAAGRIDLLGMARQLRVRDGRGLVPMAVVLDGIPDLPAAGMLRRAGGLLRVGRMGKA